MGDAVSASPIVVSGHRIRPSFLVAAFVATIAAFVPTLWNGFLRWDDRVFLVDNPHFRGFSAEHLQWMLTTTHHGPYQPLAWLTYAADHAIWGMDPRGYHLTSLLLHALSATLLVLVLARLLRRAVPALAERPGLVAGAAISGALLWSCHPLRVESVAWATERRDVLGGLLLAGSLLAWLRHVEHREDGVRFHRSTAYWVALVLFALSLATKTTPMAWFLVLLLLDTTLRRRMDVRARILEKLPFALVAIPLAAMAWHGQETSGSFRDFAEASWVDRILIGGYSPAFYAAKSLVPFDLRAHYERPEPLDPVATQLMIGLAVTCVVSLGTLILHKRWRNAAVAWWSYLLILAPVSGLATVGSHLVAERYSYTATLPLVVLAAGWGARWVATGGPERAGRAAAGAGFVIAILGVSSARLTTTWRDTATLFERVTILEPTNWRAHSMISLAEEDAGNTEHAIEHWTRALALPGYPKRGLANAHLAALALRESRNVEARTRAEQALTHVAEQPLALRTLATLAEKDGKPTEAAALFERVLAEVPTDALALYRLARIRWQEQRTEEVQDLMLRLLKRAPDHGGAWEIQGHVHALAGELRDAEDAYRRALELDADTAGAASALAGILASDGRHAEAETVLRKSLRRDPAAHALRHVLAVLLMQTGRAEEAESHARQVVEASPNDAQALALLGGIVFQRGERAEGVMLTTRAVIAAPNDPSQRLQLSGMLLRAGKYADARNQAERVLAAAQESGNDALAAAAQSLLDQVPPADE